MGRWIEVRGHGVDRIEMVNLHRVKHISRDKNVVTIAAFHKTFTLHYKDEEVAAAEFYSIGYHMNNDYVELYRLDGAERVEIEAVNEKEIRQED